MHQAVNGQWTILKEDKINIVAERKSRRLKK
jgi:hypothetical protein